MDEPLGKEFKVCLSPFAFKLAEEKTNKNIRRENEKICFTAKYFAVKIGKKLNNVIFENLIQASLIII